MKKGTLIVAAVAMVLALASFLPAFAQSKGEVPKTIKIGVDVPLTGAFANFGKYIEYGYKLAVDDINAEGGIFVKEFNKKIPIELIVLDNSSDPVKVGSNLELLHSRDRVVLYLGGFGSGLNAAAAGVAEKNKVPYIGSFMATVGIHKKGYTYFYSPFPKMTQQAEATFALLDSVPKDNRPSRIAIFEVQNDMGKEMTEYWKEEAKKRGYNVVAVERYSFGNKDYSPLLMNAKAARADVMLDMSSPPGSMTLLRQLKELKIDFKFNYLATAGDDASWHESVGNAAEGVTGFGNWFDTLPYPRIKEIKTRFHHAFPGQAKTMPLLGSAYSVVQIAADAVKRANGLDGKNVRDALATTKDLVTTVGKASAHPDGIFDIEFVGIRQWQGPKEELVYPVQYRTKPLMYPIPSWKERK